MFRSIDKFCCRKSTNRTFPDPDLIKVIPVDRSTLPQGDYRSVGFETRQVVDLDISTFITEWRAEILENQKGKRHVAPFPKDVTRPVQYGVGVKVNAVYMSQYQLIPYNRIEDHFLDQMGIPVSAGSIVNFSKDVFVYSGPWRIDNKHIRSPPLTGQGLPYISLYKTAITDIIRPAILTGVENRAFGNLHAYHLLRPA